jgi:hypothetical protein
MSRELKFRIWDNLKKEWVAKKVYHASIDSSGEFSFKQHSEGFAIQQYTGVKDVNDKKIYEGDIVWLNSAMSFGPWEKENNRFEIVFHRGCFQLKPIKLSKPQDNGVGGGNLQFSHMVEIIGHDADDMPVYEYHLPPPRPLCDFNICEVMGNVFDNPELLK